ncbi:type II toxin-antitoxin system Phd/YefM family antitoxin [Pseudolysinimonas yzui]|uniref:Antitoxin n=1 Tax=Pseudolysinimonas yzui TaxID=2708254 RepID=A0A8J3DZM6_9MICO|nr:type II toxin-antitoxin system Phd/YefM family antitoxin [Pseudolysinimonas yzui]GHF05168.1 antitoxin [Pseudolysinimonas yzui]
MSINIYEAKTQLSKLIARVEEGEEITISRNGRPAARLVPIGRRTAPRVPGALKGQIVIHDDFDELDEETLSDWYGE